MINRNVQSELNFEDLPHRNLLNSLLKNINQVNCAVAQHPLEHIPELVHQTIDEENEELKKKKYLDKIVIADDIKKINLEMSEANSILQKITNTPSHKLKNVMFKKMLLKYIYIFYEELLREESNCEHFCEFVYSMLIRKYSMKKAADSKFSHLLSSCIKYKSITRIRFLGLYEAFDNEDLKFYIDCLVYLQTSPSGTTITQESLESISTPYIRCVECIKFYEKSLPSSGLSSLRIKLDKMRRPDKLNRLGCVDQDEFLEQIVETYNDFNKSTKNFMKSIYEAADLNDDGYLQFKEFELLLRYLTEIPYSQLTAIELFSEYSENFLSEEEEEVKAISFDNLCQMNKHHKIFKASSIRKLTGINNHDEASRMLTEVQSQINDLLAEFLWRFSETLIWEDHLEELKTLLASVEVKVSSKKDPVTAFLAFKLIDLESKRVVVEERLFDMLPRLAIGFS
jgi:hypothetical protein